MRMPTIDETRAFVYMVVAVSMAVALLFLVFTGRPGTDDLILKIMAFLMGLTSAVNGVALHKRNSSGKLWTDPHRGEYDDIPPNDKQV